MEAEASFQQASVQSSFAEDTNVLYCDTPEITTAKNELDTYCRADQQTLALQMQRASEWAGIPMGGKGEPTSRKTVEDMVAQIMKKQHGQTPQRGQKRTQPPSDRSKTKSHKKGQRDAPKQSSGDEPRIMLDLHKWNAKHSDVNGTKACFFHLNIPKGCSAASCKNSHTVFPAIYQGKTWAQLSKSQQEVIAKGTTKS
jgi:hypothetical protein